MKSYNDLMIDLETLGTSADAVILQIGWCFFDAENESRTIFTRGWYPDVNEQVELGFQIDFNTMKWWQQQGELYEHQMKVDRQLLADVVEEMIDIWRASAHDDTRVWAKGTHFDLPILRKIMPEPWNFRNIHDVRTALLMAPTAGDVERQGTAHDAVDDAMHQAKMVMRAIEAYCG